MFEESVSLPSIWASMNSWFTPTVLFVLLNIMIGTIAFTSSLTNQKQQQEPQDEQHQQHQPLLARSPSVLQRLRSINFYSYRAEEPRPSPPVAAPDSEAYYVLEQMNQHQTPETDADHVSRETHFEEEREGQEEEEEPKSLDEVYSQLKGHQVDQTMSDTKPASGEIPEWRPARMKKSASAKSAFTHFEEDDVVEARRPATVREGKAGVAEVDDEVDAKADDFINKFKQQLKLQRVDSIRGTRR